MTVDEVLAALKREATSEIRDGMTRYAIPNDRAFGVGVRSMRALAKRIGPDHALAAALWETGWYEARPVAEQLVDRRRRRGRRIGDAPGRESRGPVGAERGDRNVDQVGPQLVGSLLHTRHDGRI